MPQPLFSRNFAHSFVLRIRVLIDNEHERCRPEACHRISLPGLTRPSNSLTANPLIDAFKTFSNDPITVLINANGLPLSEKKFRFASQLKSFHDSRAAPGQNRIKLLAAAFSLDSLRNHWKLIHLLIWVFVRPSAHYGDLWVVYAGVEVSILRGISSGLLFWRGNLIKS